MAPGLNQLIQQNAAKAQTDVQKTVNSRKLAPLKIFARINNIRNTAATATSANKTINPVTITYQLCTVLSNYIHPPGEGINQDHLTRVQSVLKTQGIDLPKNRLTDPGNTWLPPLEDANQLKHILNALLATTKRESSDLRQAINKFVNDNKLGQVSGKQFTFNTDIRSTLTSATSIAATKPSTENYVPNHFLPHSLQRKNDAQSSASTSTGNSTPEPEKTVNAVSPAQSSAPTPAERSQDPDGSNPFDSEDASADNHSTQTAGIDFPENIAVIDSDPNAQQPSADEIASTSNQETVIADHNQELLDLINKYIREKPRGFLFFTSSHFSKIKESINKSDYLKDLFVLNNTTRMLKWKNENKRPQTGEDYEQIVKEFEKTRGNGEIGEKNHSSLIQKLDAFLLESAPNTITARVVLEQHVKKTTKLIQKKDDSAKQAYHLKNLTKYIATGKNETPLKDSAYMLAQQVWLDSANKLEKENTERLAKAEKQTIETGTNKSLLGRGLQHILNPVAYFTNKETSKNIQAFTADIAKMDANYQEIFKKNTQAISDQANKISPESLKQIETAIKQSSKELFDSDRFMDVQQHVESAFRQLKNEKISREIQLIDNQFADQISQAIDELNPAQVQTVADIQRWFNDIYLVIGTYQLTQLRHREQWQSLLAIDQDKSDIGSIIKQCTEFQNERFLQLHEVLSTKVQQVIQYLEGGKRTEIEHQISELAGQNLQPVEKANKLTEKVNEYKSYINSIAAMLKKDTEKAAAYQREQVPLFKGVLEKAMKALPPPVSRSKRIKQTLFGVTEKPSLGSLIKSTASKVRNKILLATSLISVGAIFTGVVGLTTALGAFLVTPVGAILLISAGAIGLVVAAGYIFVHLLRRYAKTGQNNEQINEAHKIFKQAFDIENLWDQSNVTLSTNSQAAY